MRLNFKMLTYGAVALTGILFIPSCTNDDGIKPGDGAQIEERGLTSGAPVNTALIGLSPANELVSLMSGPPVSEVSRVPIINLRPEENLLAIDTRPKTKELFGISDQSILYKLDPATGDAVAVSGTPITPAIEGSLVGFDFSPIDDMIRLVTDKGQALRISPITGAVVGVDILFNPSLNPINSIAISYATPTWRSTLYDLDATNGNLYRQSSANGGSLVYIGATGFSFTGEGGFEITSSNTAFAVQFGKSRYGGTFGTIGYDDITQDSYRLYTINLRSGQATSYGKVAPLIGLAAK
jgi:hypothetical protein